MSEQPSVFGGRYRVIATIGRGGMAEVYLAADERLGRRVAIKVLRSDLARDPVFLSRFRREAQAAAGLNHPRIVAVYDTGEQVTGSGTAELSLPYIVMEYVDGTTVRDILREGRPLLPDRAMEIVGGVLEALDYSHRNGIVHRDIKPGNVMLTTTGDVKVMDFGIARALADSSATMTGASTVMGTAQYLSPEQARGDVVDARSDLYSTGVLFFELLTGRPPFTGDSPVAIAYQHVSEAPVRPSQVDPRVPPAADAITMKALAKSPAARYQSAAEFAADLRRAARGVPVSAAESAGRARGVTTRRTGTAGIDERGTMSAGSGGLRMRGGGNPSPTGPEPLLDELPRRGGVNARPIVWAVVLLSLGIAIAATAWLVNGLFGFGQGVRVAVPDLGGLSLATAEQELLTRGLVLGTVTPENSDRPPNTVLLQNPLPGTALDPGQPVALTVSAGREQVTVPPLVGLLSVADAQRALAEFGLVLGTVTEVDGDPPAGRVLSSVPAAGSVVDPASRVDIEVANGLVEIPNVVGRKGEGARRILQTAGFVVETVEIEDASVPPQTVLSQFPEPGGTRPAGSRITITVAIPPAEVSPTSPVESTPPTSPDPTPPPGLPTPAPTPTPVPTDPGPSQPAG